VSKKQLTPAQLKAVATQAIIAIQDAKNEWIRENFNKILAEELKEFDRLEKEEEKYEALKKKATKAQEKLRDKMRKKFKYINSYGTPAPETFHSNPNYLKDDITLLAMRLTSESIHVADFDVEAIIARLVSEELKHM
jgi:hypothetical protein